MIKVENDSARSSKMDGNAFFFCRVWLCAALPNTPWQSSALRRHVLHRCPHAVVVPYLGTLCPNTSQVRPRKVLAQKKWISNRNIPSHTEDTLLCSPGGRPRPASIANEQKCHYEICASKCLRPGPQMMTQRGCCHLLEEVEMNKSGCSLFFTFLCRR